MKKTYKTGREVMQQYLQEAQDNFDNFAGEEDRYDDEDEDGYDEDAYDEDGYDEDGYDEDGYDEDGFAAPRKAAVQINPNDNSYQVIIRNTTAARISGVKLFGSHYGYGATLPAGVAITAPKAPNGDYNFMLAQLATEPAQIYALRAKYSSTVGSANPLLYVDKSGRGLGKDLIVTPLDYENPMYNESRVVDMPFNVVLKGSAYIEIDLEANETLVMSFYVGKAYDAANSLSGKSVVETRQKPAAKKPAKKKLLRKKR